MPAIGAAVAAVQRPASQAKPPAKPAVAAPKTAAPESNAPVTADQLRTAINNLSSIDYAVRSPAARVVRRAEPAVAIPALTQAVKGHADQYVRYRALVILSGFNDPRTRDLMASAIADKNDRLRTVAYSYFERNPDKAIVPRLRQRCSAIARSVDK